MVHGQLGSKWSNDPRLFDALTTNCWWCFVCCKVPKGGWFSLLMTAVYGWTMITWFYGSGAKARCVPVALHM